MNETSCFSCKRKLYIFDNISQCNYCNTPEWIKFFKIASKNIGVRNIIIWFDRNILRTMYKESKSTLNVRIRIVCGMINKEFSITRDLKIELMELIWQKYKEKQRKHDDFIAISIFKVPFLTFN